MSTFGVKICNVASVEVHPNAHSLDIIRLKDMDWSVVTQKGLYHPGDLTIYFPVDSVLPQPIEERLFGKDSKVVLNNSRIRTIKLRGAISQGMCARPDLFIDILGGYYKANRDVTKELGITKYDPPTKLSTQSNCRSAKKRNTNPYFHKYGGIENSKNYANLFNEGEEVAVTEKLHGANFRCGWVEWHANTFWKKLKKFIGYAPKYEFVYGSNNVQLQNTIFYKGYHGKNIYKEMVDKYQLKDKLFNGEVVYGEVYGDGVQKNYLYDCQPDERKAAFFDLKRNGKFVEFKEFLEFTERADLPVVPLLYIGPFNKNKVLELCEGSSILSPNQKIREGCVVKTTKECQSMIGRKILKFISDAYLLKNQDEEATYE